MTFDMTQCKIGDKLKTRRGKCVKLTDIDAEGLTDGEEYPFIIDEEYSVTPGGTYYTNGSIEPEDIVGFWEEESPSDNDTSSPTITITHNLTIKGYTHVLTTAELMSVYNFLKLEGKVGEEQ